MKRENRITLKDGRSLSYAEYGAVNGIPLIGFHGTPGSRMLLQVFDELAQEMQIRIIAPERPGCGLSSPNPAGTLANYPQDIVELCDQLNIDRFMAMGVSGGGPYSLTCAYHLGDCVSVAGIVSGIGPLRQRNSLSDMMMANRIMFTLGRISPALAGWVLPRLIRSSLPSMMKYVEQGTSPTESVDPATFVIIVDDQRESIRSGGRGIRFDMNNLWQEWQIPFDKLSVPVFLWHGASDDLAPTALAHYLAEQIPGCRTTFYLGEDHIGPLVHHKADILMALKEAHLAADS